MLVLIHSAMAAVDVYTPAHHISCMINSTDHQPGGWLAARGNRRGKSYWWGS